MPRGTNLPNVGYYNQSVVLNTIRRTPEGLSQVELAELTGLSTQTVSNITRRLLSTGFLHTYGSTSARRGKPRVILRVDPTSQYAVGVHLDPSLVTAVLVDFSGAEVASFSQAAMLDHDPAASVAAVAARIDRLISDSGIPRSAVAGVGIAAPGPLDVVTGALIDPPWLDGWHGFGIREAFADALGFPTLVDKDTVAAATGECWTRHDLDGTSLLFMYLGTGVGSAVAMGGNVTAGPTHNSGEIGHLLADVEGTPCLCGRRGCLGRASDPVGLVLDASARGILAPVDGTLEYADVDRLLTALCDRAAAGDTRAVALLARAANAVAEATRILVSVHDANLVVFGGPFWSRLAPYYRDVVARHLTEAPEGRTTPTVIESTVMGDAVSAFGAATLVFEQAYSTRLSRYVIDA